MNIQLQLHEELPVERGERQKYQKDWGPFLPSHRHHRHYCHLHLPNRFHSELLYLVLVCLAQFPSARPKGNRYVQGGCEPGELLVAVYIM